MQTMEYHLRYQFGFYIYLMRLYVYFNNYLKPNFCCNIQPILHIYPLYSCDRTKHSF